MKTIHVMRHGEHEDGGLTFVGMEEIEDRGRELRNITRKTPIYHSPVRRARETAVILSEYIYQGEVIEEHCLAGGNRENLEDLAKKAPDGSIFVSHEDVISDFCEVGLMEGEYATLRKGESGRWEQTKPEELKETRQAGETREKSTGWYLDRLIKETDPTKQDAIIKKGKLSISESMKDIIRGLSDAGQVLLEGKYGVEHLSQEALEDYGCIISEIAFRDYARLRAETSNGGQRLTPEFRLLARKLIDTYYAYELEEIRRFRFAKENDDPKSWKIADDWEKKAKKDDASRRKEAGIDTAPELANTYENDPTS